MMNLTNFLNLILQNYSKDSLYDIKKSNLGNIFRVEIVEYLKEKIINNERYIIEGSIGKGNWAKVPWVSIFDRFVTESATQGFYIVYLFKADMSGVFLSLNQGVTTFKKHYKSNPEKALQQKANDYIAQLGFIQNDFSTGYINLEINSKASIGNLYQYGSILSKEYIKDCIPTEKALWDDLNCLLDIYNNLSTKQSNISFEYVKEDDEEYYEYEYLNKIREHKVIERNQKLTRQVKEIHGYKCQACGFSFSDLYKEIGDTYIEAHHLTPLSKINEDNVKLNPKTDFAVLCSNCHRMIHRTEYFDNVELFKEKYLKHIII
ncbi:DUF3578 domain-containing protein [Brucepastera parasyntrophica]|uniref:MrcB family domain-containing protein n=1 Tax=Brucepastera parasyntrophica TaxID=2880008 RepID=UPI00210D9B03|nr:DUF3578 domain-containing protein [Brucepastera parasyntrophica]ULQ58576.1 DUF3578 domain-containing protein [Brucepastera parasyntrophica]